MVRTHVSISLGVTRDLITGTHIYTCTHTHTHTAEQQMLTYRNSLPQKNVLMTSSIGSVATLITMADEECGDQTEDVGRVGGWITSFDKLLADPLGVQCLLVRGERDSACW